MAMIGFNKRRLEPQTATLHATLEKMKPNIQFVKISVD